MSWQRPIPGQRPGPQDARDTKDPCPFPMGGVKEEPKHDWAKVGALLEDLIEDDNCTKRTYDFLSSLNEQLDSRGQLSDKQVRSIYDIEERRQRGEGRSF